MIKNSLLLIFIIFLYSFGVSAKTAPTHLNESISILITDHRKNNEEITVEPEIQKLPLMYEIPHAMLKTSKFSCVVSKIGADKSGIVTIGCSNMIDTFSAAALCFESKNFVQLTIGDSKGAIYTIAASCTKFHDVTESTPKK